jgi:hypothetical protein
LFISACIPKPVEFVLRERVRSIDRHFDGAESADRVWDLAGRVQATMPVESKPKPPVIVTFRAPQELQIFLAACEVQAIAEVKPAGRDINDGANATRCPVSATTG